VLPKPVFIFCNVADLPAGSVCFWASRIRLSSSQYIRKNP
jgi:hypothetical protein